MEEKIVFTAVSEQVTSNNKLFAYFPYFKSNVNIQL